MACTFCSRVCRSTPFRTADGELFAALLFLSATICSMWYLFNASSLPPSAEVLFSGPSPGLLSRHHAGRRAAFALDSLNCRPYAQETPNKTLRPRNLTPPGSYFPQPSPSPSTLSPTRSFADALSPPIAPTQRISIRKYTRCLASCEFGLAAVSSSPP